MNFPGFIGPTYRSQSVIAGAETCMNFYPEAPESSGRAALYPVPGFDTLVTATEAPGRGLFSRDGRAFSATAHVLYEIDSDFDLTNRGPIIYDSNPVQFFTNGDGGDQMMVVSGNHAYILDLNSNVLSDELTGAYQGGFLDGFFLALDRATSTLQISALRDGTTWDATQVALRSARPDKWQSMIVSGGVIWLFGTETSEVWFNTGLSPFPFALIGGAVVECGILAPFSAASLGPSPVWLGQSKDGIGIVYRAGGNFAPERISNHSVETALRQYADAGADLTAAVAWTYQEEGHHFYCLNIADADATWCYDAATNLWHERGYWDVVNARYLASRAQFHAYAHNAHIVADRSTGAIYQQSLLVHTDVGGAVMRRVRRAPHLVKEHRLITYNEFRLDVETGLGLVTGQGSDPRVQLRLSRNAGKTYWNAMSVSAHKKGDYDRVVQWDRLGDARDAVFECVFTDPIPWRVSGAYLDFVVGRS